jgi:hypothetical protein
MVIRVHGTASAFQSVTGGLQYYTVWASSPNAFSDPSNATGVNIAVTGNIQDPSQKNFEVLVQSIGLRAMPALMSDPAPVAALENAGATTLTGEGFVWRFASEREGVFATDASPVGLLVAELNGIVLPNGTILDTAGAGQNIEFIRSEQL